MKKMLVPALFAMVAAEGFAQETVAAGALNSQMSWAALQNQIGKVSGDVATARMDINALRICSIKGKLYSTDATVARDGNNCREADVTTVKAILKCNAKGKLYTTSPSVPKDADGCREIEAKSAEMTVKTFGGYTGGLVDRNIGKWKACFIARYNTVENNHGCEVRQAGQTGSKGQNNSLGAESMDFTPNESKNWIMRTGGSFCAVTCFK